MRTGTETIVDRSGHARELLLTVTAVYEEGKVSGVLAIGRDVTDEKRAAYKAAEADKLRALGQLASGVAHDFNNMLAAILGRAQILKRQTDDERFHRGLDIIETAANDGAPGVIPPGASHPPGPARAADHGDDRSVDLPHLCVYLLDQCPGGTKRV